MNTIGNKTNIMKKTKTSSNNSDVINEHHSTKHTISTKRSLLNDNPIKKLKTTKTSKLSTAKIKSKKKQKIDVIKKSILPKIVVLRNAGENPLHHFHLHTKILLPSCRLEIYL